MKRAIFPLFAGAVYLASATSPVFALDDHNPIGVTGAFEGMITTGCAYNVVNHNAYREIDDIVVPGSIGKYPLKMARYYNSRRALGGMAIGWTHEYMWRSNSTNWKVDYPNGNVWDVGCFPEEGTPLGVSDGWVPNSRVCDQNGCRGDFRLADGGTVHFDDGDGNFQARTITDPYGLTTTITYAGPLIDRVTEPGGRYLQFSYTQVNGTLMLTGVDAYDGIAQHSPIESVDYVYTPKPPGQGHPLVNCLTSVNYGDGTHAKYTYTQDNVPEHQGPPCPCSYKFYPLLYGCDDVRYHGPMRRVAYEYEDQGPHGAIHRERYWDGVEGNEGSGAIVSRIDPPNPSPLDGNADFATIYTEYRGDGPTRKFTYTDLHLVRSNNGEQEQCPTRFIGPAPQQFLQSYTDFQSQSHTTQLGYDGNRYVNSVTDANSHTTSYLRGPPPNAVSGPKGIGEIKKITYQDNAHIDYTYQDESPNISGHYLLTIKEYTPSNATRSQTIHTRDANTHKITQTEYKDGNMRVALEAFTYCDQADGNQCGPVNPTTLKMHGQIKRHQLKNGAYVHYKYSNDGRGLLVAKTEPTWNDDGPSALTGPKTTYSYYTSGPWTDRVMTVTGPLTNWPYSSQTSETYEYDENAAGSPVPGRGLVTKITHADGKYQQFKYDAYGNKTWEDNELRHATSYTCDEYNRLTNVTTPLNGITTYSYNPTNGAGTRLSHTTSNPDTVNVRTGTGTWVTTRNVYDENFRKTSSTVADGTVAAATTWFHYDAAGYQDYVTDPRGSSTPTTQWTTYTDYDSRNRKWRVREPLGRTTQFYYDDGFNLTRTIRGVGTPESTTETKAYDGMNRLKTETVQKQAGVDIVTQFQYNPWNGDPSDGGHSASLLQKVTDGENHNTTFQYDASALKTKMTYHDLSSQSWAYDDAHNLKSRTTTGNATQNFAYDSRKRKTGEWWDGFPADGEWRVFGYDDANHLTLATNGLGNPWTNFIADVRRAYDDAGRLTNDQQTVYVNGVPNSKSVIYPTYDDDGRVTRMYVNGLSGYDYTFGYDEMRRLETIKPTVGGVPFEYSYDLASNGTQRFNWYNRVAQIYDPDELNRIASVEVKNTSTNTRLGIETYDYYTIGRLRSVTREDNKQDQFVYFLNGELKQATYGANPTATPSPSATPTPTPGGQVVTPAFNPDGALFSACANSYTFNVTISTTTSGAQIRWTIDGTPPSPTTGNLINGSSGIASFTVGSNQTKTLKAIAYKTGMTPSIIHSADYTFEHECAGPNGPLAPESDSIEPYPLEGMHNGLTQGPLAPAISTVTYTLDKAGNRTAVNGTSYSPNVINQYTSVGGNVVTNGNNHEIQAYGGYTYTYMRDQELTQVTGPGITYDLAYDALGRCVRRNVNGDARYPIYYIYDGDKPIVEYRANGQIAWNLYGKGVDETLLRVDPDVNGGQAFYFQQDHEGSVTHLTNWNNGSGQIIERYRYDAFGAPTFYAPNWTQRGTSSYNNRFLFTGREYAGVWHYEYRARMYYAGFGRFMSEDPKLFDAGDYNLFRYCHNDPIDFSDPMGLADEATGLLQSGTHDRVWDMTKWFDRSNLIQGNFRGFASMSDRDAKGLTMEHVTQTQRSMHTYSLKPEYNIQDLGGADGQYKYISDPKYGGECMTAVQHLTGAPSTSTPMIRGEPVGPNTPPGTAIATNWIEDSRTGLWIYPSKLQYPLQHAAILAKNLGGAQMQVLHQYRGTPLHFSHVLPTANWFTVTGNVPPSAASTSEIRPWIGPVQQPMY